MTRQAKVSHQRKSQRRSTTSKRAKAAETQNVFFEQTYPTIAQWVMSDGWIEIGRDDSFRRSMVRALDPGGLVWESDKDYASLDELLRDLENGLIEWLKENG